MIKVFIFSFFFISTNIFAFFVGNPLDPILFEEGFVFDTKKRVNIRLGYINYYIYKGQYEDEFKTIDSTQSNNLLTIYSGILTFNIAKRVDLYGTFGTSNMQIDRIVFARKRFCWSLGAKTIFYKTEVFAVGADVKYFEARFHPDYFLVDGFPMDLLTNFTLKYYEAQAAASVSYQTDLLVPYIGITYLFSKIQPMPMMGLLEASSLDMILDFDMNNSINRKRWGMVLGASILSSQKMSLNLESRMIDQNAINISGQLRF